MVDALRQGLISLYPLFCRRQCRSGLTIHRPVSINQLLNGHNGSPSLLLHHIGTHQAGHAFICTIVFASLIFFSNDSFRTVVGLPNVLIIEDALKEGVLIDTVCREVDQLLEKLAIFLHVLSQRRCLVKFVSAIVNDIPCSIFSSSIIAEIIGSTSFQSRSRDLVEASFVVGYRQARDSFVQLIQDPLSDVFGCGSGQAIRKIVLWRCHYRHVTEHQRQVHIDPCSHDTCLVLVLGPKICRHLFKIVYLGY